MVDTRQLDALVTVSKKDILEALSLLRSGGLQAKTFPTPSNLFTGCSLSIAVASRDLDVISELLLEAEIEVLLTSYFVDNPVRSFYDKTWN
ncbi:MAG: DUF3343 domain-containing protein [Thermotogaceae bacterium]|nr:DUF3343 domain-containing protein [Thermotogaceae bacterium]